MELAAAEPADILGETTFLAKIVSDVDFGLPIR
jgi:hypothetical protein